MRHKCFLDFALMGEQFFGRCASSPLVFRHIQAFALFSEILKSRLCGTLSKTLPQQKARILDKRPARKSGSRGFTPPRCKGT